MPEESPLSRGDEKSLPTYLWLFALSAKLRRITQSALIKIMFLGRALIFLMLAIWLVSASAGAQQTTPGGYSLHVDGLARPFYASGIEK